VLEPEAQSESRPPAGPGTSGGTPAKPTRTKTKICSDEYLGKLKEDAKL
jgi:hypothetical protein